MITSTTNTNTNTTSPSTTKEEMMTMMMPSTPSPSSRHSLAMERYLAGIRLEEQGSLSQALICFQQAFKLDPDIDVAYSYKERRRSSSASASTMMMVDEDEEEEKHDHVTVATVSSSSSSTSVPFSFQEWIHQICEDDDLMYSPRKKTKPIYIAKLPGEIVVHILCHLVLQSLGSVAQFALACKPFLLLTRSPTLWRHASEYLFLQPTMSLEQSRMIQHSLLEHYHGQWMLMMKERPRLRYDGVYIATCQYVRPGVSEMAWTRPVHLVTYYRYLRFFTDGSVLSFISNDAPSQVVKLLVPAFTKRQVFRGTFEWDGDTKVMVYMKEDGRWNEEFKMHLNIRHPYSDTSNKKKRRPYKLTWDSYTSYKVNDDYNTGILNTYDMKLMKPFIFSAVTSYHVDFSK